jgi:hypothetical protein
LLQKKGMKTIFFPPLFMLLLDLEAEIRDPEWKNQDPGSRIPDKHPGSLTLTVCSLKFQNSFGIINVKKALRALFP